MAEEKTAVKKQEKQDAPVRKTGFFKGVKAEFKKIIWPSKATVAKDRRRGVLRHRSGRADCHH